MFISSYARHCQFCCVCEYFVWLAYLIVLLCHCRVFYCAWQRLHIEEQSVLNGLACMNIFEIKNNKNKKIQIHYIYFSKQMQYVVLPVWYSHCGHMKAIRPYNDLNLSPSTQKIFYTEVHGLHCFTCLRRTPLTPTPTPPIPTITMFFIMNLCRPFLFFICLSMCQ